MRKDSIKNRRINGEVSRALAQVIHGELKDPRVSPVTSITEVRVAPDLKTCKVYISTLGDEQACLSTLEGLRRAEGFLRCRLASIVNLRITPELQFLADRSIAYGVGMTHRIEEVMAQDRRNGEAALRGEAVSDDEDFG